MRAAVLAALALMGGAAQARTTCPAGLRPVTTAQLFFGADDGGRAIGDADWKAFLDAEVTPRFPAGLTVWGARGQWRGSDGAITREGARVMLIVLDAAAPAIAPPAGG